MFYHPRSYNNGFLINLKNLHRSTIFAAFEVFLFTFKGFHYEAKNGYIGIWYIKHVSEKSFKICSEFLCHKKWKSCWKIPHTGDTRSLDACKAVVDKGLNMYDGAFKCVHLEREEAIWALGFSLVEPVQLLFLMMYGHI